MISTAAAVLGSAVIGGVASAYNNNKAVKSASQAAADATAANAALARENQAAVTNLVNPFMTPAYGATGAIADRLGLGTTRNVLSDGGMTTVGQNGAVTTNALAGQQPAGQTDWAAYLQQNPDALANFQELQASGRTDALATDPIAFAQNHYQTDGARRPLPTMQSAAPAPQQSGPAPANYGGDYAPPTYERPGQPSAPGMPDLTLASYTKSPNYDFQMSEGQRNLNSRAAAGGLLNSGAAVRDAIGYGSNLALGDYNNWRNNQLGQWQLQLGQYNTDRNVLNDNFNQDRGFGYTTYADQRDTGYGRFDTQTNDLFRLSGQGLAGAGLVAGANSNTTANLINGNNNQASTSANAALAGAANTNNLINSGLNAVGYYYGNKSSPTATGGGYAPQTSYGPINPYRV